MATSYSEAARPASVGDSLSRAWLAVKANIWLFAGFTLLFFVGYFIVVFIPLLNIAAYLFSFVLPVSIYTAVEAADGGREIRFSDFFTWTPQLSRLLIGMLIQMGIALAVIIPLFLMLFLLGFTIMPAESGNNLFAGTGFMILGLLMVVFGFVYGVFTFSLNFLLLKQNLSIGETLRLSWKTGWQNVGGILLLALLCFGLYLLGCIALVIGLLVTIPLMFGSQYFFLSSRFPDHTGNQWDFDNPPSPEPYQLP